MKHFFLIFSVLAVLLTGCNTKEHNADSSAFIMKDRAKVSINIPKEIILRDKGRPGVYSAYDINTSKYMSYVTFLLLDRQIHKNFVSVKEDFDFFIANINKEKGTDFLENNYIDPPGKVFSGTDITSYFLSYKADKNDVDADYAFLMTATEFNNNGEIGVIITYFIPADMYEDAKKRLLEMTSSLKEVK